MLSLRLLRSGILFLLAAGGTALPARTVQIQVLATTDLHANLLSWDYLTGQPAQRGLAKIATLIEAERRANPNSLLVDCGDTIQGTPLASLYQGFSVSKRLPFGAKVPAGGLTGDPMMLAMNALGYDAMVLGNHEFNFGLASLERARSVARFPWLSANTRADHGRRPFQPYLVKSIGGVKVAVIGITTPAIPVWEKPENYSGYQFLPGEEAARQAVAAVRKAEQPDLVIVAAHSGLDRDPDSQTSQPADAPGENMVYQIATRVDGIDGIVFGHTHREIEKLELGGALLVQPKNWGQSLASLTFAMEEKPGGGWRVRARSSRLRRVEETVTASERITAIARPYHEATEAYLQRKLGEIAQSVSAANCRSEDTAAMDAIQQAQLHYARADVSLASCFDESATLAAGPLRVRDLAALYVYDNDLLTLQGNGRMLREALENAAHYFTSCPESGCPPGAWPINRAIPGYQFDMAQGVSYEIDVSRAPGDRIRNLRFRGKPLSDAQPLRIALNHYAPEAEAATACSRMPRCCGVRPKGFASC